MDYDKAIEELYPHVEYYCKAIASGDPLCDDLIQETMLVVMEKPKDIIKGIIKQGNLNYYACTIARLNYNSVTSRVHYKYRKRKILELPPFFDDNIENNKLYDKLVEAVFKEDDYLVGVLFEYIERGSLRKLAQDVDIPYSSLHKMFKEFNVMVINRIKDWEDIE